MADMGRKILISLVLALVLIVAYIYIPLFPSEAQPAVQVEQPAVDVPDAAEVPLVVPTLAIKDSAFSEKQSEPQFKWSEVDASTLSNLSYG
jgi:hypothetical protein